MRMKMRMRNEVKRPAGVEHSGSRSSNLSSLKQQLPHQKSNRTTINNTNLSLLISSSSCLEINDSLESISSYLSSERQSTIKASITPTPTLTSTASSSTHESSPSQPPSNKLPNLPFPSLGFHGGSIDQLTVNPKSQRMTSKCGTVTEENSRGVDDPVCNLLQEPLALSGQLTEKGKPIKEPSCCCSSSSSSISKPNSLVSLTGSDFDFLEDDEPAELKKRSSILSSSSSSSSSNQKRPTRLGRLPRSNSSSTSFSIFGNNNVNNDSTPRIRTRPSLTPSLMSDCSSSPFTEAEDDINKGFFDDIEFPPEFGIPNNLHPASTPSNPSSLPSSKLHKPIDQAQAGLDWDKDIVLPEGGLGAIIMKKLEDEKDQKDQKAKSKEDIRTSRGKNKVRLES
ncbi:hypothetical protein BY996DRAFT_8449300 [Phakopsora pachyrhizi]|nr:hypothetical protein BY996DRAFT_8449300 [Phakopsora pachyrhizi]